MAQALREKLVQQIEAAFAETPYPETGFVGYDLEDFNGLHWRDVSLDLLRRHRDDMWNFSPEGFRFFIPAALLAVVKQPDADEGLLDKVMWALAPPKTEEKQLVYFTHRLLVFTRRVMAFGPAERAAVCAFIDAYETLKQVSGKDCTTAPDCNATVERAREFWSRRPENVT